MMYLAVKELQQQSINGSPPTTVAKQLMFDGKNVNVKMDQCINGKCQTKKMTMKNKKALRRLILAQRAVPLSLLERLNHLKKPVKQFKKTLKKGLKRK